MRLDLVSHSADASLGSLLALMGTTRDPLVNEIVKFSLLEFTIDHTAEATPFNPLLDACPRHVTSWHTYGLSVGAK